MIDLNLKNNKHCPVLLLLGPSFSTLALVNFGLDISKLDQTTVFSIFVYI